MQGLSGNAKRLWEIAWHQEMPEQEFDCPQHGRYKGNPLKGLSGVINPSCPECEKERESYFRHAEKNAEMLQMEGLRQEKERYYSSLNIGKRFWHESFETFNAYTPALKRFLDICIAFARDNKGRMLVMLGKNGNGKNHLASSILKTTGGLMLSVFEMELLMKECYSGESSEFALYERLCKTPMLAINEIGKHKPGKWEMDFLSYIINKRYENYMPMILISNAHLKADCPQKGCPECLQNFLGNDVLSRIVDGGEIMLFGEKDYRHIKRQMQGGSQ